MKGYLRYGTEQDIDLLFSWANHPTVRRNSFNSEKISYEEHKRWYENVLKNEAVGQYIYVYGDEAVGQIRVEIEKETGRISYSIFHEKTGQGHGKRMLQLLKEQVKKDFPEVKFLVAEVKTDNRASEAVLINTGYEEFYRVFKLQL